MRAIISRFAPAPTGFLHLGHVLNAIVVWGIVRRANGRVLLRIEDHDRQRSRTSYEAAILEDLEWLGFTADAPLMRQSERGEIYARALGQLRDQGLVYACSCSRAEIARDVAQDSTDVAQRLTAVAQGFSPAEPRYAGTCRHRNLPDAPGTTLRVHLDPSIERFTDMRHGAQEQRPSEQCGDIVIRDRDGNWTYQFAVTVDDMDQDVTLVVRGDDLLDSTGRQLQLARLLGRAEPPRFLHHPLIMKSRTQKLSKSDHDTGVRDLRAAGWTAERVIGQAALMAGLISESRDVQARDVSSIISTLREVQL